MNKVVSCHSDHVAEKEAEPENPNLALQRRWCREATTEVLYRVIQIMLLGVDDIRNCDILNNAYWTGSTKLSKDALAPGTVFYYLFLKSSDDKHLVLWKM